MSMVAHRLIHLNSHLEVYIIRYMHRTRGKKIRSVLPQIPISLFAVPMDIRTCHFHRIVGYLENGYRKIRISSRMMIIIIIIMMRMMTMIMMMMRIMTMMLMIRHCEGVAV